MASVESDIKIGQKSDDLAYFCRKFESEIIREMLYEVNRRLLC